MNKELYPPIEPNYSDFFDTQDGHQIYFEECGNSSGVPILFLHGGPGSGVDEDQRRFFDPKAFRIILLDQRGSGKSLPYASLENNTTWKLVEDIERLRKKLQIDKWHVFGGSWGSTLSLCYAILHPTQVLSLTLRGIFLGRKIDIDWFYRQGAHLIYPDEWEKFLSVLNESEKKDPLASYYTLLTGQDEKRKNEAAFAWTRWEGSALKLCFDEKVFLSFVSPKRFLSLSRIEAHYFVNGCFFENDNFIIDNASKLSSIPTVIVHGRYDMICPLDNAWALKKALPHAELIIIPDAGHSAKEPGILNALIQATEVLR